MCTDRERLAYEIRCDARYTRDWIGNFAHQPDDPSLPGTIGAAQRYIDWWRCGQQRTADQYRCGPAEFENAWRREAVGSNVQAAPYDLVSGVWVMLLTGLGIVAFLIDSWPTVTVAVFGVAAPIV